MGINVNMLFWSAGVANHYTLLLIVTVTMPVEIFIVQFIVIFQTMDSGFWTDIGTQKQASLFYLTTFDCVG